MDIDRSWVKIRGKIKLLNSSFNIITMSLDHPFIIKNALSNSKAVHNWSQDYLNATIGEKFVDVFVSLPGDFPGGEGPYDETLYCYIKMSLSEFLSRINSEHVPVLGVGEKYYIYQSPENLYSKIINELPDHMVLKKYIDRTRGSFRKHVWISAPGNITPPHTDVWLDNFLVQVHGLKRILLWDPAQAASLYIRPFGQKHSRQSPISLCLREEEKFPAFTSATAIEGIIGPGDILFIPEGWVHYIQTLSFSISVNYWNKAEPNLASDLAKLIGKIKQLKPKLQNQYLYLLRWPNEFLNLDDEIE